MPSFPYETLDVFTDRPFGGNQLAVFTDARGLSDVQMQSLAAEMNYSETTFVLPPDDPANDARVRIFHRTAEMPFAGHPNVGTACVLARHGRDRNGVLRFEQMAGLVEIAVERDAAGAVTGAVIAAPQALSLGIELPVVGIAACAGVASPDIVTSAHRPVQASLGVKFVLVQVAPAALAGAMPDIAAFRKLESENPELQGRLSLFLYARDGNAISARMFAPLAGTWEDPATGSASATLGALLLSLDGGDEAAYSITQGVEMGRPSRLNVMSRRAADGVRSRVGGNCVPMFRGEALL
ncbi:MAG: PhzF family phenazine biosynthesis protein [Bosea sp.]|uniref:PhzF family phenazine biosynthesis protein n=1 Tax=Bosea sp. (in: a-proteobacteria) TaxID=1871050 RepID=UPI001AC6E611|nr:PhzF family phenazine biosynthesis protein [Bosea sp. (in: a-proteobacteria)]MBN9452644.1 PhzF family phenazine biosynthesis protein [Bosea sp. (in: a-proteobacteria)]